MRTLMNNTCRLRAAKAASPPGVPVPSGAARCASPSTACSQRRHGAAAASSAAAAAPRRRLACAWCVHAAALPTKTRARPICALSHHCPSVGVVSRPKGARYGRRGPRVPALAECVATERGGGRLPTSPPHLGRRGARLRGAATRVFLRPARARRLPRPSLARAAQKGGAQRPRSAAARGQPRRHSVRRARVSICLLAWDAMLPPAAARPARRAQPCPGTPALAAPTPPHRRRARLRVPV